MVTAEPRTCCRLDHGFFRVSLNQVHERTPAQHTRHHRSRSVQVHGQRKAWKGVCAPMCRKSRPATYHFPRVIFHCMRRHSSGCVRCGGSRALTVGTSDSLTHPSSSVSASLCAWRPVTMQCEAHRTHSGDLLATVWLHSPPTHRAGHHTPPPLLPTRQHRQCSTAGQPLRNAGALRCGAQCAPRFRAKSLHHGCVHKCVTRSWHTPRQANNGKWQPPSPCANEISRMGSGVTPHPRLAWIALLLAAPIARCSPRARRSWLSQLRAE